MLDQCQGQGVRFPGLGVEAPAGLGAKLLLNDSPTMPGKNSDSVVLSSIMSKTESHVPESGQCPGDREPCRQQTQQDGPVPGVKVKVTQQQVALQGQQRAATGQGKGQPEVNHL